MTQARDIMKVVGAIDVGSNAIRMSCAYLTEDRRLEYIDSVRTPVRLGKDVFKNRYISKETEQEMVEAFEIYCRILEQNQCQEIRAYATSAFRESKNQEAVAQRIFKATGIQLEQISGGKEARLLQHAVQRVINLEKGSYMMADLGGGSVEISIIADGEICFAESFRLGTVRLLQMFPYSPDKEEEFLNWGTSFVEEFLQFLKSRIKEFKVEHLILTGGNAKALTTLGKKFSCAKSEFKKSLTSLHKADFKQIKQELESRTLQQRIEELGLAQDRADVILPASIVFERILGFTGCKMLLIPDVGLREGILGEMLTTHYPNPQGTEYQQVLHSAYFYAKKYEANLKHSQTVCKLCVQMFDATARLHNYGLNERLLLEVAAILHDIGRFIRPSNHHKHSMYLIQNMELVGVTNYELKLISLIARFHNRSVPSEKHEEYAKLSKKAQKMVNCLVGILKVADALDRDHQSSVHSVTMHYDEKQILLVMDSQEDLLLTRWSLENKKDLFEEVFERALEVGSQADLI